MRDGVPGWRLEMPHIVGSDISGEVAQVGSLVKRLKPGHRVLLAPGVSCGQCEMCFNGLDSACRQYSIYGVFIDGGYAEYVKSPESNVLPVPSDLSCRVAGAGLSQHNRPRLNAVCRVVQVNLFAAAPHVGLVAYRAQTFSTPRASPDN